LSQKYHNGMLLYLRELYFSNLKKKFNKGLFLNEIGRISCNP
jgi:hypothetical protein